MSFWAIVSVVDAVRDYTSRSLLLLSALISLLPLPSSRVGE